MKSEPVIRVLVVDDSPTVRHLLCAILGGDPGIEVVGEAANGAEAVDLTHRLKPDLVTMDIHMPVMDGREATKEIMIHTPTPVVIVSASSQLRDVTHSFDAMDAGALALVAKPVDPSSADFNRLSTELLSTVKSLAHVKVVRRWPDRDNRDRAAPNPSNGRVVGIAASTGGPAALGTILGDLRAPFRAPILVVQHIADGFIDGFVTWLAGRCHLPVVIAEDGAEMRPGTVYLAPDGCHLIVGPGSQITLSPTPPLEGHRPSATHLFRTLASACGPNSLAVILTGMGRDGVSGLEEVKAAGGTVLAQNRETSVVYGMNGEAERAGLADAVLPLGEIAHRLTKIVEARS